MVRSQPRKAPRPACGMSLVKRSARATRKPARGSHTPEDYEAWLPRAGFRVARAELFTKDMPHADRDAFLGWLRTTWFAYTDRLPAELRDAFCDEVADAYTAARPPDAEGVFHVRMMRLEVEASVS